MAFSFAGMAPLGMHASLRVASLPQDATWNDRLSLREDGL